MESKKHQFSFCFSRFSSFVFFFSSSYGGGDGGGCSFVFFLFWGNDERGNGFEKYLYIYKGVLFP